MKKGRFVKRLIVTSMIVATGIGGVVVFKGRASAQPEEGAIVTVARGSVRIGVQEVGAV